MNRGQEDKLSVLVFLTFNVAHPVCLGFIWFWMLYLSMVFVHVLASLYSYVGSYGLGLHLTWNHLLGEWRSRSLRIGVPWVPAWGHPLLGQAEGVELK